MWRRKTESSVNKIILKVLECNLKMGHTNVETYMCMLQVKIQVKIFQPRLILNFLCFLALIIRALGLRDQGNIESTEVKEI